MLPITLVLAYEDSLHSGHVLETILGPIVSHQAHSLNRDW